MKHLIKIVFGVLVLVSISTAGIVMTTQFQDLKNAKAQPMNQTTYLEQDKIRIDMKDNKTDMSIIFFGAKANFSGWSITKRNPNILTTDLTDLTDDAREHE